MVQSPFELMLAALDKDGIRYDVVDSAAADE